MSWLRYGLLIFVLFLVVLVGTQFAVVNSEPVAVNYLFGKTVTPLSIVVVAAFSLGIAVAALVAWVSVVRLKWRNARLRRAVASREQSLRELQERQRKSVAPT